MECKTLIGTTVTVGERVALPNGSEVPVDCEETATSSPLKIRRGERDR